MKKTILLVLVLFICTFLFAGCNKDSDLPDDPTDSMQSATPTPVISPKTTVKPTAEPTLEPTPDPTRQPGLEAGGIVDKPELWVLYQVDDVNEKMFTDYDACRVYEDDAAFRFYATTDFDAIHMKCPNWNNTLEPNGSAFTAYIYQWQGDYESTLESEPLYYQEMEEYENNAWVEFKLDKVFSEGDYLVVLSDPVNQAGLWYSLTSTDNFVMFHGGIEMEGTCAIKINYLKTPTNKLGRLD